MEIRKAITDDAPRIAALESELFSDPWSERDILPSICSEGGICYVAVRDGELAAYIIGRNIAPEGEIYRIATAVKFRRRGIAYRLLDYCVKCEKGKGLECLFLEVRAGNTPAINLYKSYGFKDMGTRKNYYRNPTEDAILMVRSHPSDFGAKY